MAAPRTHTAHAEERVQGYRKVGMDFLSQFLRERTAPRVKLHCREVANHPRQ